MSLYQTISRIRRAMPRNADVMTICDELEKRLTVQPSIPTGCPKCERFADLNRQRAREGMRKLRAAKSNG